MTYYEELGVYPDASPEEIRSEYRRQARLFHPDHQIHPRLKEKSEARMRLLNEIVSVLGDPAKRIEYDRLTLRPRTFPRQRPRARRWWGGLTAAVALASLGWYGPSKASNPAPIVDITPRKAVASAPEKRPAWPLLAPRILIPEPTPATVPSRSYDTPEPALPYRPQLAIEPPLPLQIETAAEPSPAPQAASVDEPRWTGDWFYVPTEKPTPTESGLYPPIYTELHLQEHSGTISGNYRAIYLVSDKAISGEVRFQVTGRPMQGPINALQWKAASGASGKIELTQRAANLLHVAWWTTRSGDGPPSLGSGSAVLVRQAAR